MLDLFVENRQTKFHVYQVSVSFEYQLRKLKPNPDPAVSQRFKIA